MQIRGNQSSVSPHCHSTRSSTKTSDLSDLIFQIVSLFYCVCHVFSSSAFAELETNISVNPTKSCDYGSSLHAIVAETIINIDRLLSRSLQNSHLLISKKLRMTSESGI